MDELKEACLAVAKDALKPPSLFDGDSKILTNKLGLLRTRLESIELTSSNKVAISNFVFFPVKQLLQQNHLSDKTIELVFYVISFLCDNIWLTDPQFSFEIASQLLLVTSYLLNPSSPDSLEPSKKFTSASSQFHMAGFQCLNSILTVSSHHGFASQIGNSPAIPNLVIISLTACQHDLDNLQSQLAALNCLNTLVSQIITNGDHLALILPQTVSKLTNFVSPANKRHYSAKVLALDVIVNVLNGCFSKGNNNSKIEDSKWMEETCTNILKSLKIINKLLDQLLAASKGTRPELINAIWRLCKILFLDYNDHLVRYTPDSQANDLLINMIFSLKTQDISLEVVRGVNVVLESPTLKPMIYNAGIDKLNHLTTGLQSSDITKNLELVKYSLESYPNPDLLVDALQEAVLVSVSGHVNVNEKQQLMSYNSTIRSIEPVDQNKNNRRPLILSDLGLKLSISEEAELHLAQFLKSMNHDSAGVMTRLVTDLLQSQTNRGSLETARTLWIASMFIAKHSDCHDILKFSLDNIVSEVETYQPAIGASNAISALALYNIGEIALVQSRDFKKYLIDVIHPVFAMLGDANSMITRVEASNALAKIAVACGYDSAMSMAVDNQDYLVDGISVQLNTLNLTPSTPEALASLIYISGPQIVPYLNDVFTSLFILMDQYHGYYKMVRGIMTVFGALTHVLESSIPIPKPIEQSPRPQLIPDFNALKKALNEKPHLDIPEAKLEDFDTKSDTKSDTDSDADSDDEIEEDASDADDDKEKWDLPIEKDTYVILERIADYCDRLMTHEQPEIRLATLSLITSISPLLALNETHFLPLVHKTWPEVTTRLFDSEIYVVEIAFKCLQTLTKHARDFVSKRIDDLWPEICVKYTPLLLKSWPQFAPERRLCNALCTCFQTMIESLDNLSLKTLESALVALKPSFKRKEHESLQISLQTGKPSTADLYWLVMLDKPVYPPNDILHVIHPVY